MAIARVECTCKTCGKTFEVKATRANSTQAREFEEWAVEHCTECHECSAKRKAEQDCQRYAGIDMSDYSPLRGSEKQIAWANDIRRGFISQEIDPWLNKSTLSPELPKGPINYADLRAYAVQIADAKWWIDALGDAAIYRAFTALQEVSSGRRIISPVDKPIRHERMFTPMDNPRIQALLDGIAHMEDGKIVIWCKFTHEIEDVVSALERTYGLGCAAQFHGKIRPNARDAALERFRGETRFLVANKGCAGLGLNLQHCHMAIYYNNDWNWAMRVQSEDRIHRIGQEHTVKILDICADAGIDGQILRCLDRKEHLADRLRSELNDRKADAWLRARAEDVLKEGLSNDWHRL